MNTDDLIRRLSQDVRPAKPLPGPWVRAAAWIGFAAGTLIVLALARAGSATEAVAEPQFIVEQAAALAVGLLAAAAAFATAVPGYRRRVLAPPLAAVAVWVAVVGAGAAAEQSAVQPHWICTVPIVLGAVVPAFALVMMLRRGAPLTPRLTMALGVLAAASLANVAACVFDPMEGRLGVLIWHGGTILLLVAAAAGAGRILLPWRPVRP